MWLIYLILAIALPIIIRHIITHILHRIAPLRQNQQNPIQPAMDKAEAYKILGIQANATDKEIKEAYHRLMQKLHPDAGGNDYFASQLNRARDILLSNKRG